MTACLWTTLYVPSIRTRPFTTRSTSLSTRILKNCLYGMSRSIAGSGCSPLPMPSGLSCTPSKLSLMKAKSVSFLLSIGFRDFQQYRQEGFHFVTSQQFSKYVIPDAEIKSFSWLRRSRRKKSHKSFFKSMEFPRLPITSPSVILAIWRKAETKKKRICIHLIRLLFHLRASDHTSD